MAETKKSHERRVREGWFDKYAPAHMSGIDLGCQHDPLNHTFRRWDIIFGDGDATHMRGVPDNQFQTVYASHLLEHLEDYATALRNWYRICRPGGHVIVCVPSADLYEKKDQPPSRWNGEHKWFYLLEEDRPPRTISLKRVIQETLPEGELVLLRVLDEGWISNGPDQHSGGEYSLEAIVRKP